MLLWKVKFNCSILLRSQDLTVCPLLVVLCLAGSSDPERGSQSGGSQEKLLLDRRGLMGDSPRDSGCYESNENLENGNDSLSRLWTLSSSSSSSSASFFTRKTRVVFSPSRCSSIPSHRIQFSCSSGKTLLSSHLLLELCSFSKHLLLQVILSSVSASLNQTVLQSLFCLFSAFENWHYLPFFTSITLSI